MIKTFTSTRAPSAQDGRYLRSWSLSAGGIALVVRFCELTSGTPIFEVQLPVNTSASQTYDKPGLPSAGWHIEVVSGTLNRGMVEFN